MREPRDYDFVLRCADQACRIGHVPEILYHWRTSRSSTADNPASKMYAYDAGKRAIEAHLQRRGEKGEVSLKKDLGFYRVVYPVKKQERISVVIPSKDQWETLKACLDSIREKTTYPDYEIIVVENNSREPETFEYYKTIDGRDNIRVITWDKPFNYSAINNFGIRHASGQYVICLNNDIQVITGGWMEELLGVCQREEVGVVGAKLYYPTIPSSTRESWWASAALPEACLWE